MAGVVRAEYPCVSDDLSWFSRALCAQSDPAVFFPLSERQERAAKKVCAACPVLSRCLAYAVRDPQLYGVWGGTSEAERSRIRDRARTRRSRARNL